MHDRFQDAATILLQYRWPSHSGAAGTMQVKGRSRLPLLQDDSESQNPELAPLAGFLARRSGISGCPGHMDCSYNSFPTLCPCALAARTSTDVDELLACVHHDASPFGSILQTQH